MNPALPDHHATTSQNNLQSSAEACGCTPGKGIEGRGMHAQGLRGSCTGADAKTANGGAARIGNDPESQVDDYGIIRSQCDCKPIPSPQDAGTLTRNDYRSATVPTA